MSANFAIPRREFLKNTAVVSGSLIIGFHLPALGKGGLRAAQSSSPIALNAFLRIDADGVTTVIVNKSEMGQGIYTSLPMILAEELDADWKKVRFEAAPAAPEYKHTVFGIQLTGGSTSVWSSYDQLRQAGAMARAMLVAAAADAWKVDPAACRTENGTVIHSASNQRLSYGALAAKASTLAPPGKVQLKDPKDFKLIGKPIRRLDTPEKINGKGIFGIDMKLPGMLTAVIARPPVFGSKMMNFNAEKAKAISGVRHVVPTTYGVAVVADGFWAAKRARDLLEITWNEGLLASLNSSTLREQYAELAKKPGVVARKQGDAAAALTAAATKLQAEYEVPYLAHATMEPLNCVADVRADGCDVWTGTQSQTIDQAAAAEVAGLKPEQVRIHTTLLGGGFGRRAVLDSHFVREAVEISKAVKAPVKVIWTREDDIRGGYYRPFFYDRIAAGLDANGNPVAWTHTIVGQSFIIGTPFESFIVRNGVDAASVEGAADLPYAIPNIQVDVHNPKIGVPTLWWRSVGHSHTAFVVECFLDELAHAARKDSVEFRGALLAKHPRHKGVLELAAGKADWGKPLPPGRGRGIAVHESFGSFIAHVAEVTVAKDQTIRVDRVVCGIDCGQVVNPDTVKAQMESGIVFGLTAAQMGEITFERGRVKQRNFHDYPMLRMHECPSIEVHIMPSTEKHGGCGEPGVPPIAPAVGNAISAATGKRLRRLPFRLMG